MANSAGPFEGSSASSPVAIATQPQIIRAHQRDLLFLSSLREQTESVFRSILGTRTLSRWEKETDLLTKLCYFGLTTGRGHPTLGEEYTDIWQLDSRAGRFPPSAWLRASCVLLLALPEYLRSSVSRLSTSQRVPDGIRYSQTIQNMFSVLVDINMALFYFKGKYYNLVKRFLRLTPITMSPPEAGMSPPSYGLLGILLSLRLLYRLYSLVSGLPRRMEEPQSITLRPPVARNMAFIDERPIASVLQPRAPDDKGDDHAHFDLSSLTSTQHFTRRCALCLEERTATCATQCGHLFCWTCVVDWVREKPECPLCRQKVELSGVLAVYNL